MNEILDYFGWGNNRVQILPGGPKKSVPKIHSRITKIKVKF